MTLIDLTQDEQTLLLDAMHLKLWEMARQGASAMALQKLFSESLLTFLKNYGTV